MRQAPLRKDLATKPANGRHFADWESKAPIAAGILGALTKIPRPDLLAIVPCPNRREFGARRGWPQIDRNGEFSTPLFAGLHDPLGG